MHGAHPHVLVDEAQLARRPRGGPAQRRQEAPGRPSHPSAALWPPIEMVPMSAVANVLKGMMREYIDTHGFRSLVPRRKLPLTNSLINGMLGVYEGARRGALVVARESYYWQAMLCLFVHWSITSFVTSFVTKKIFVMHYELRNELRNEGRKLVMHYEALVTRRAVVLQGQQLVMSL